MICRVKYAVRRGAKALAEDDRWLLDDPRLRGWKLATADTSFLNHLGARHTIDL